MDVPALMAKARKGDLFDVELDGASMQMAVTDVRLEARHGVVHLQVSLSGDKLFRALVVNSTLNILPPVVLILTKVYTFGNIVNNVF